MDFKVDNSFQKDITEPGTYVIPPNGRAWGENMFYEAKQQEDKDIPLLDVLQAVSEAQKDKFGGDLVLANGQKFIVPKSFSTYFLSAVAGDNYQAGKHGNGFLFWENSNPAQVFNAENIRVTQNQILQFTENYSDKKRDSANLDMVNAMHLFIPVFSQYEAYEPLVANQVYSSISDSLNH